MSRYAKGAHVHISLGNNSCVSSETVVNKLLNEYRKKKDFLSAGTKVAPRRRTISNDSKAMDAAM